MLGLSTVTALAGFIGAFAAHLLLQFRIDHDRVRRETGESGWRIFGSILAPADFYKDDAKVIWKIQRIGLKVFAISLGIVAIIMLVAAAFDISIE